MDVGNIFAGGKYFCKFETFMHVENIYGCGKYFCRWETFMHVGIIYGCGKGHKVHVSRVYLVERPPFVKKTWSRSNEEGVSI